VIACFETVRDALGKLDPARSITSRGMQKVTFWGTPRPLPVPLSASQVRDKIRSRLIRAGAATSRHPMPPRLRRTS